jgi:hypothetical protein
MAGLPDFPAADTGAISALAENLQLICTAATDAGEETQYLRDLVLSNEQWQGSAAQQWHDVVTERVGDAGLTSDVMGTASAKLAALAADLNDERANYDRLSYSIAVEQGRTFDPDGGVAPAELVDPLGVAALRQCVARAEGLLAQATTDLLELAILAGDIRAQLAPNRTPGIPAGTDRNQASLQLLTMLFGSVRDNQLSGRQFEDTVLKELGLTKNTEIWRPDPAFEGRLTLSGQAKGTTPDGQGDNFILEIKGTDSQTIRFQLRLQALYARQTGRPLWVIKQGGKPVTDSLVKLTERAKGGVIYRTGPGRYVDGHGNPVQVTYNKDTNTLDVQGYVPSTQSAGSGGGADPTDVVPTPDPDAPSAPVDPTIADGDSEVVPAQPVAPVEPVEPVEPIEPIEPLLP